MQLQPFAEGKFCMAGVQYGRRMKMIDLSSAKGKKLASRIIVGVLVFAMVITIVVTAF